MRLAFVQLAVRDRAASAAWYRAVAGMREVMSDEAGDFTLLEGDGGRLALKGGRSSGALLEFETLTGEESKKAIAGQDIGRDDGAAKAFVDMLAQRTQQVGRNGFDGRLQHGSSAARCRGRSPRPPTRAP